MTDLVRSAVLNNYVGIAQSAGLDPYQMAKAVGLSPACLSEPEMKIPAAAVHQLLENSAAQSGLENFGLRLAETRKLSNMGLVGAVARDAPTLRHALALMMRYMGAHSESLFLTIDEEGSYVTIRDEILLHRPGTGSMRQVIELSLGALVRIIRVLLGDEWAPQGMYFSHAAPLDLSLHRRVFNCWMQFGYEFNGLVCHQRDMDRPIATSDPVMAKYAQAQLDSFYKGAKNPVQHEVRQLASFLLPSGRCSMEQIARHLCVDRRTVHRQLAQENTSFASIINEMRVELSQRYLAENTRTLSEISVLLGFSGPSALAKWHIKHLGMTASERRQAIAGKSAA